MKLFKRKNFQSLIYAIFISLPILSLLPNLLYFGFNEKASDYTDVNVVETYEYETNEVNTIEDLIAGNIYHFSITRESALASNIEIGINEIYNFETNLTYGYTNASGQSNRLRLTPTAFYLYFQLEDLSINNGVFNNSLPSNYSISVDFVYSTDYTTNSAAIEYITASYYLGDKSISVVESEMNPQNAFEYTISKFIKDNNFGNIDFFSFFSTLFLGNSTINAVYVGFVNWYLNYILYVSLAYLLFSVLLWFVNFARKLLEDTQNVNIGGF